MFSSTQYVITNVHTVIQSYSVGVSRNHISFLDGIPEKWERSHSNNANSATSAQSGVYGDHVNEAFISRGHPLQ